MIGHYGIDTSVLVRLLTRDRRSVIDALEASGGTGLFGRLIADDYSRAGMEVLTLDRKMAALPDARRL